MFELDTRSTASLYLHNLIPFPTDKEPRYSLDRRLGGSRLRGEEKVFCIMLRIEPLVLSPSEVSTP